MSIPSSPPPPDLNSITPEKQHDYAQELNREVALLRIKVEIYNDYRGDSPLQNHEITLMSELDKKTEELLQLKGLLQKYVEKNQPQSRIGRFFSGLFSPLTKRISDLFPVYQANLEKTLDQRKIILEKRRSEDRIQRVFAASISRT